MHVHVKTFLGSGCVAFFVHGLLVFFNGLHPLLEYVAPSGLGFRII